MTSQDSLGNDVHTLTIDVAGEGVKFETGRIGRQASSALMVTRGETVIYSTACRDGRPKPGLDFIPLSVDYQERFSSVGATSGGYNKRDGRPGEREILTSRLITVL